MTMPKYNAIAARTFQNTKNNNPSFAICDNSMVFPPGQHKPLSNHHTNSSATLAGLPHEPLNGALQLLGILPVLADQRVASREQTSQ
jgi:hypothetical protein